MVTTANRNNKWIGAFSLLRKHALHTILSGDRWQPVSSFLCKKMEQACTVLCVGDKTHVESTMCCFDIVWTLWPLMQFSLIRQMILHSFYSGMSESFILCAWCSVVQLNNHLPSFNCINHKALFTTFLVRKLVLFSY